MNANLLLKAIQEKNEESFQKLFYRRYAELVIYAQNYLFDKGKSEDMVQDVFIYVWEHADTIEIKTSLKAYLYTMVRNRCLNYLRSLKITDASKHLEMLTSIEDQTNNNLQDEQKKKYKKVLKVIETFPESMKEIFRMKYFENYTYAEIATELNISVNTVKTQLKRAKQKIGILFLVLISLYTLF